LSVASNTNVQIHSSLVWYHKDLIHHCSVDGFQYVSHTDPEVSEFKKTDFRAVSPCDWQQEKRRRRKLLKDIIVKYL
tara:strand:- start:345 stop:575 length:231 start_codon:yes stop_codon:yes gene_type:complete